MTEPQRKSPHPFRLGWVPLAILVSIGVALGCGGCAGSPVGSGDHPGPIPSPAISTPALKASPSAPTLPALTPLASVEAPTPGLTPSPCPLLWLGRPIPLGFTQFIDPSYPFGSTQGGTREPHHGVDLENPQGTPVVAAAPGTVVFAGNDLHFLLGPSFNFYGNVVVLQLDRQPEGRPIFLLQGHLSEIAVKVGQHVLPGDLLGRVGLTGVAIGAHLHFEVRLGTDQYTSVRNPELWLAPRSEAGTTLGALAGRVVDASGHLLPGRTVTLRKWDDQGGLQIVRFLTTYDLEADTAGSDDLLKENFAVTDLEPGIYQVTAYSPNLQVATTTVRPGKLAWVDLGSGPDPLPACSH